MSLRKNNEGMSLVELIISMAITAIVLSMIVMIISVASKSFTHTNENVSLQMEAQVAINQISTLVMEASAITVSDKPDGRYLLAGNPSPCYGLVLRDNKLYLIQADTIAEVDNIELIEITDEKNLMAEYVESIDIIINNKSANISLLFKLGDTDYSISKKVKLRNVK